MTGCPDADCKQRQHELRIDVKRLEKNCGEFKLHMHQMCSQMLKKKHVWLGVAAFGVAFFSGGIGMYHEVKSADDRFVRKDSSEHQQVLRNDERIKKLEEGQREIKSLLNENKRHTDDKLEKMSREILRAIQNGGR